MSTIKITGVSQTKFFNMTKEALSLSLGSNITRTEVVDKFLMNLFRLKNKHSLSTLFNKNNSTETLPDEQADNFSISKKHAIFEYCEEGSLKLVQVVVHYQVTGYKWQDKITINQGTIESDDGYVTDMYPTFTDYNASRDLDTESNNQKAATNLHMASNHAFELSTWLNTVKRSLEPNDLKADDWNVKIFGCGLSCQDDPRDIIDGLKYRARPDNETQRSDIELTLLELSGVDIDSGYFHDDVIYAIKKLKPLFGNKFDGLLINK